MWKLGAFGFLSSTEIQQNGALNAGILDMAFALQWVQDHIGKFGGYTQDLLQEKQSNYEVEQFQDMTRSKQS